MISVLKKKSLILGVFIIIMLMAGITTINNDRTVLTSSGAVVDLSNKKIEWGIKRNDNHKQPDLGSVNKGIIDKYNGMAMGNDNSKKVYLTFDMGYEAGYTEKILAILRENDVKATFFITAHYVNTKPELVQKMIDEGHIVGNHTPNYLMSGINKV